MRLTVSSDIDGSSHTISIEPSQTVGELLSMIDSTFGVDSEIVRVITGAAVRLCSANAHSTLSAEDIGEETLIIIIEMPIGGGGVVEAFSDDDMEEFLTKPEEEDKAPEEEEDEPQEDDPEEETTSH